MAEKEASDLAIGLSIISLLFICAATIGVIHIRLIQPPNLWPYGFVLGTALSACVLLYLLGSLFPALFGKGFPRFPLTLTIPVAYLAVLVMTVVICWNTGDALVKPQQPVGALLVWLNPSALLILGVVQFVVLQLASKLRR